MVYKGWQQPAGKIKQESLAIQASSVISALTFTHNQL
jgi:hypothetical protein